LFTFFARAAEPAPPPGRIDVRRLLEQYTVEELNEAAEQYFRRHASNAAFYLKKPLGQPEEAACQLAAFAQMLRGLGPLPGMRLLDFGVGGACWAARHFADFQLEVVACEVSPSALELGRRRFALSPPVDSPFEPSFEVFDGHRIAGPDAAFDRIACFDALHRVPNPREVLRELGRVLKPGGVAGFSEPGPFHSQAAQSQFEMRHYSLVQNDIVLEALWPWAQEAGFTDIRVAVFTVAPFALGLAEFAALAGAGGKPLAAYAAHVRRHAAERRLFFLRKGEPAMPDSRGRAGLACELRVELYGADAGPGGWVEGRALARNTGAARWLPSDARFGPVKLGVHLKAADGWLVEQDFARADLPAGRGVEPGETAAIAFRFQAPAECGYYRLVFDLVSEGVCWFEANGAQPAEHGLSVG
jgi:ubiquinone/menaquinone biosynthesis C-methylase UbiE